MQRAHLTRLSASILVLCAASALAYGAGGNGKKDSQISLVRPEDPPDGDAKGTLRIRHKGNGDSFEVHVMKVDEDAVLHLWMEDPLDSDLFTDITSIPGGGSKKLKLDTKKGDTLPLGVTIDELIGRRVEIREGLDVVLLGVVPPWDLPSKPQKAKIKIEADDEAPAPDMYGKLSLRSKANKGQERIDFKTKKVPWDDGPFHVFIEDGVDSDVFVDAGDMEKTDDHEGRWRRDTKKGQALPDGVNFVSELAGRVIELRRTSDDEVYLSGVIPAVE